eukprot:432280-Pleurochrysis_carterae.AAC.1
MILGSIWTVKDWLQLVLGRALGTFRYYLAGVACCQYTFCASSRIRRTASQAQGRSSALGRQSVTPHLVVSELV